jgi:hypothetical protein
MIEDEADDDDRDSDLFRSSHSGSHPDRDPWTDWHSVGSGSSGSRDAVGVAPVDPVAPGRAARGIVQPGQTLEERYRGGILNGQPGRDTEYLWKKN